MGTMNKKKMKRYEFWNWTPKQKGLLNEIIKRMIMTSHWSTGRTRIMFEKAMTLAIDGQIVMFVLYYSEKKVADFDFGKYVPILLYCSLLNEKHLQENKNLKENLRIVLTDSLERDVMSVIEKERNDIHVFVDEFAVDNEKDTKIIDDLSKKVDDSCYVWVTLARVTPVIKSFCDEWLEQKRQ